MNAVQISDDLSQLIDRQVAEGRAASAAEFLEAAVRLYADELDTDDDALAVAAEQGITALRSGDFVTIDSPQAQRTFWEEVRKDANQKLGVPSATASTGDVERHQPPTGSEPV